MESKFYADNRRRLVESLQAHDIFVSANSALQASADMAFPFRQDSSFLYLSGLAIPDAVLHLGPQTTTLFLPHLNSYQEAWDGSYNHELLTQTSGIEHIRPMRELTSTIKHAAHTGNKIACLFPSPSRIQPYGFYANPARRRLYKKITRFTDDPVDARLAIARLRQIKQPPEIAHIQAAIDATATTLEKVRTTLANGGFRDEKSLERAISAGFFAAGADGHAYEPIVASGKNASIIHYNQNDQPITKGDVILLDVGARVANYNADISRTWSTAKPTDRQQALFDAVLELQQFAFQKLKPGVMLRAYQQEMELEARRVMKKLTCATADQPYPHGFSHFLGLDVHDAGDYDMPLAENMVLTVEPGIYEPTEGIGIRIEDDVIVTADGVHIMSRHIPKTLV